MCINQCPHFGELKERLHCTALHYMQDWTTIHATPHTSIAQRHIVLFQVLGGLGIAVYLVGFPLMTVLALRHIAKNKLHCDKNSIALWGVLYTKYEASAWW